MGDRNNMASQKGKLAGPSSASSVETDQGASSKRGRPGRRTGDERAQAVLELLAGKASIQQLAMRFSVHEQTIVKWRDDALAGMNDSLRRGTGKSPRERELEKELKALKTAFTDLAIRNELAERALKSRPSQPGRSAK